MDYLPVSIQTLYADLVDRAWTSDYQELLEAGGSPYKRIVGQKTYWYIRPSPVNGERKKPIYLGPDNEKIIKYIQNHQNLKNVRDDRIEMVRALRSARLPVPDPVSGKIMSALAQAGAFRLRAVIVGTAAFQTYAPLLGVRFNSTNTQTGDLDIAQFHSIGVAIEDEMADDFLSTLKKVDDRFVTVPSPMDGTKTLRYVLRNGRQEVFSVDVLSPLRGHERRGRITHLESMGADAQLIRYLDFLIYQEVNAVSVYGLGIPINVPDPTRYAIHKMIVAQMRKENRESMAKSRKDLRQSSELIRVLAIDRPYELKKVWDEALDRGPKWRDKLMLSIEMIEPECKEALLTI